MIIQEDRDYCNEQTILVKVENEDNLPPVVTQDDSSVDDALQFEDPTEASEAADVVNYTFAYLHNADGSLSEFISILSHLGGSIATLELELRWTNGTNTWAPIALVKQDQPAMLAKYVLANTILCDTNGSLARWARVTLRALRRATAHIRRAYKFPMNPEVVFSSEEWKTLPFRTRIRKSTGKPANSPKSKTGKMKKKKGRNNRHLGKVKYGVHVPRSVREAFLLDKENEDMRWSNAIAKEVTALQQLNCFCIQEQRNWSPNAQGYQYAPLQIVFDVKPDG